MNRPGFSLVEVLLSVSLFGLLVTALAGALIYGQQNAAVAGARARAVLIAEEGLEATRNIRDGNYASMTAAAHGLAKSDTVWSFSGTSDVTDTFTRVVTISTGANDTRTAVSTVTWQQTPSRTGQVSLTELFTNWQASTPTPPTPGNLVVTTTASQLDPLDSTKVIGLTLGNSGETDLIISKMTVSWSGVPASRRLNDVRINGTSVWSGSQKSGVEITITPTTIVAGATGVPLDWLGFNASMATANFTILFTMADATTVSVTFGPV